MISLYEADENDFESVCKDLIMERLEEMEGQKVYGCDLSSEIAKPDNEGGTMFVYKADAVRFIQGNWAAAEQTFEDHLFRFGKEETKNNLPSPFDKPGEYTFFMEDYGVRKILATCPLVNDNWDEELIITPEIREQIGREIYRDERKKGIAI